MATILGKNFLLLEWCWCHQRLKFSILLQQKVLGEYPSFLDTFLCLHHIMCITYNTQLSYKILLYVTLTYDHKGTYLATISDIKRNL